MAESLTHSSRVVAVISAFNPSPALVEHVTALQPQVARIIVVDDGSRDSESVLQELDSAGALTVRMSKNAGIGNAMNTGFETARRFDPEFIVTFDQDSDVPAGFIDALVDEFDLLSAQGIKVGMVGPEFFSATKQSRETRNGVGLEAQTLIQSGMLMPMAVIEDLGPQRDDYFIDLVDTEYFYRCLSRGYSAICVEGLSLPHGFGHRLYFHVFGRRLKKRNGQPRRVAVSSPFRYYYRARNRIFLNREYARDVRFREELRRQTVRDIFFDFAVALYSARGKFSLLRVMLAGWRDGLRGRTGKMPSRVMKIASRVSWRHPVLDE